MTAGRSQAPRLVVSIGDRFNRELYFRIYDRFRKRPPSDEIEKLAFLKSIATEEASAENAPALLQAWTHLREAEKLSGFLNSGGFVLYLGCVQQRWLTRPFVPFPEELTSEEKCHYRRFQFQARTEQHADSLTDLQADHLYAGWGASRLAGRLLGRIEASTQDARRLLLSPGLKNRYDLLAKRLEAFACLTRNARNAISYQAQLDRVRALALKPEFNPPGGTQSGWDRQLMMETARAEIDNTAVLRALLQSTSEPLLHLAASPEEEDIRVLGPNLIEQLQRKLDIMNAHWEDYKRIFTTPNL